MLVWYVLGNLASGRRFFVTIWILYPEQNKLTSTMSLTNIIGYAVLSKWKIEIKDFKHPVLLFSKKTEKTLIRSWSQWTSTWQWYYSYLRGYCTPGPFFFFFSVNLICVFSQKIKQLWQSIPWIWFEVFQGTQKSQFHFSRNHGCEVTVNNMWKSTFPMFWSINQ